MLLSSLLLIPLLGIFSISKTLLLAVFLVLDILLFYIFFESLFGSNNKVRASFYLFLYTFNLKCSLFLLLSILTMSSIMGTTDFDALFKTNFDYTTQIFLFIAHVESPLGGSIVLAGIVLKLSLYDYTFIVFVIGVITIIYASFSTLRTTDIKELIAYRVFSNTIQGIEGGIVLGLAHGFVSSGLFICAGGITQLMPLFSLLFFILCLGNCGAPLTLNFVGEFMSLYGVFERLPVLGVLARFTVILGIYPSIILDGLHYSVTSLIYKYNSFV
ncbi:proton-translocating NADH-quinone o [Xylaria telfairii]|nr:proton-translocating NADH-quinone o [Xylaria telfairii]